jgi:short-subunit dehydrogenase
VAPSTANILFPANRSWLKEPPGTSTFFAWRGIQRSRTVESTPVEGALPMSDLLAVVTGASSGIGLSLARELAGRGYDLVICSEGERLQSATRELLGKGVEVLEVQANLSTREGVDQLWGAVKGLGRRVDTACINAGVGVGGLFYETDLNEELNMVELNCASTVHLAKHVVKHMLETNQGKILFTASIAGEMVAPREAVYAATKAFVLSFSHSLRYELRDSGIGVTAQAWTIRR